MKINDAKRENGVVAPYFIILVGAFMAMAVILWWSRDGSRPSVIGAERAALRKQNLATSSADAKKALESYGVVNAEKGIYQIPVDKAIEAMIREWRNPESALAQLAERVDLATTLPPPPPEAPSEFE